MQLWGGLYDRLNMENRSPERGKRRRTAGLVIGRQCSLQNIRLVTCRGATRTEARPFPGTRDD
eukprot:9402619-Pyramimonas_sp.AAC.1